MTKYLCDIVPLTHLPLSRGATLWYESDRQLPVGTLVRVPLFRRTVNGVVLSSKDDFARAGGIALKSVAQIIAPSHFNLHQIALATHISQTTFTPLGVVLESFLIPRVTERAGATAQIGADSSDEKLNSDSQSIPQLTPITQKFHTDIVATLGTAKYWLLRDSAMTARDGLMVSLIRHLLDTSEKSQILILLPEVLITVQTAARFAQYFSKDIIATIHHKTAAGTLSRIRDDVRSGKARIIIGTRKALVLPFANLSLIIIDEEHDMSFKQWDRAPRFDARSVARFLGQIAQCPTIAFSTVPRISHTQPLAIASTPSTNPITIVNMRDEQNATARGATPPIISEILRNEIEKALKLKQQVFLFVNKKGTSNFSICAKCRTLLACPDCDRALIGVADGHYECVHCSYSVTHAICADCSGVVFSNIGYGTQKIASMMARLYPTAQIARVDGHSLRLTHAAAEITEQMRSGKVDILIGTQMALKDWRLPNLTVVGILDADSLRAIPDISADERLYAFIANAAATVTSQNSNCAKSTGANSTGSVIVQTFHPNYQTLIDASSRDYDSFRARTLASRAMLRYQPDWRIVKIILQHRDAQRTERIAEKFHQTLTTALSASAPNESVLISPVHAPLLPKLRTFYRQQIIIKLRNPDIKALAADTIDTIPIPTWLTETLRSTPPRTIIDIDPVSLV